MSNLDSSLILGTKKHGDEAAFFWPVCRPQGCRGYHGTPQILADQLTLSQLGGAYYTRHINTGNPEFSDLPTALFCIL